MNEVMNVDVVEVVNSYTFLKEVINPERESAGLKPLDNRKLNDIIEDELDGTAIGKVFRLPVNNGGWKDITVYDLTRDQMLLVGMRQSKAVRQAVLRYIRKLEQVVLDQKDALLLEQAKQIGACHLLTDTSTVYSLAQVAQHLGVSTIKLNKALRALGILKPAAPRTKPTPNESFITEGAFSRVVTAWGADYYVTGKGLLWITSNAEMWGLGK